MQKAIRKWCSRCESFINNAEDSAGDMKVMDVYYGEYVNNHQTSQRQNFVYKIIYEASRRGWNCFTVLILSWSKNAKITMFMRHDWNHSKFEFQTRISKMKYKVHLHCSMVCLILFAVIKIWTLFKSVSFDIYIKAQHLKTFTLVCYFTFWFCRIAVS